MEQAAAAWNKIIARNRQKIDGHINRVHAYTTPEGFKFAYDRWVKNKAPGYRLIKAPTYTNKHLPDDYIQSLRDTYPDQLVDAYIEGEFVNLTGKRVYPGYDRDMNASKEEVTGNEILYIGMDFNVVHGAAVIHVYRDGNLHAVDEIHDSYDTDETIAILKQRFPHNPINVYPDATGTKRTSSNVAETDIKKLQAAGFSVFYNHVNPLVKDRVNSYNAMILNGKGDRRYFVNEVNCPHLVNSLEQQVWNDNGVPDKSTNLDHILDAGGYCVAYLHGINKPETKLFTITGGY
jgi:hypothetical protein